MDKSKKRWTEIDNLYAIGTFLVVLGHSHSSDWNSFSGTIMVPILSFIYIFHMPLFCFIAGFLFQNSDSIENIGYPGWIAVKIKRLGTPYVFLSLMALIPKYYVENGGFSGFDLKYLVTVILQPRNGLWGHFWFLPALLMIYVIMGLNRFVWGKKLTIRQNIMIVCVSLTLYFEPYTTNWFGIDDVKSSLIFFCMGMIWCQCAPDLQNGKSNWARNVLAVSFVFVTWMCSEKMDGYKPVMLVCALMMIFVCWQIALMTGQRHIFRWISNHNFTIYIYSWPFQAVVMVLASKLGISWFATTGIMFVAGIIGPIAMIIIYENLNILNNRFFDLLLGVK